MDSPQPLADSSSARLAASRRRTTRSRIFAGLTLLTAFLGRPVLLPGANEIDFGLIPASRPRLNAPFIKSPDVVVEKMIEVAQLTKDDLVYDLGCGNGRIIVTAALKSGCRGVGFDIDPKRIDEANKKVKLHDVGRLVSIKEQDIFKLDLSEANVAMMYLLPWMMQRLTPQFDRMKPGARIVSHDFYIEGVEPERVVRVTVEPNHSRHIVYLYTVPLRWNPDMPRKPPTQGIADRADAKKNAAAKKKAGTAKPAAAAKQSDPSR